MTMMPKGYWPRPQMLTYSMIRSHRTATGMDAEVFFLSPKSLLSAWFENTSGLAYH